MTTVVHHRKAQSASVPSSFSQVSKTQKAAKQNVAKPPVDLFDAAPANGVSGSLAASIKAMTTQASDPLDEAAAQQALSELYDGVFGRQPDPSGAATYLPMLRDGRLSDVVNALVASDELKLRLANGLTPSQLSTDLYRAMLHRVPDPGGHVATLQAFARGDMAPRIFDIMTSPERMELLKKQPPVITPQPEPSPTTPEPPTAPTTPTPPVASVPGVPKDAIDLSQATVFNSPQDVASWPATAKITKLDLGPNGVHVDFTKKDGADSWPDVPFGAPGDSLEYTLWIAVKVNGEWQTSGCIEYWRGLDRNGGPPDQYAENWYYDPIRWKSMVGHQPQPGEEVGFFVTAGDARNNGNSIVKERSNIVSVKFPDANGGVYEF